MSPAGLSLPASSRASLTLRSHILKASARRLGGAVADRAEAALAERDAAFQPRAVAPPLAPLACACSGSMWSSISVDTGEGAPMDTAEGGVGSEHGG